MKREIIITSDGSTTIHLPDWNESYHSKHGAIQEAVHVFINNGLLAHPSKQLNILEIGFGTGLNAWLTYHFSKLNSKEISYTGVEAYPISETEIKELNYWSQLESFEEGKSIFHSIHELEWEISKPISSHFHLCKRKQYFHEIEDLDGYDLIYFDAFGYRVQPELWSAEIFKKMYNALKTGGILTTYACRTPIKKAMKEVGFTTEKLAGPPGKREMLRGYSNKK